MNGPASQGTGPSRETLFITLAEVEAEDGRSVRHREAGHSFFFFFLNSFFEHTFASARVTPSRDQRRWNEPVSDIRRDMRIASHRSPVFAN